MGAPVKHTCPDIDAVIKKIKEALKLSKDGMKLCEEKNDIWNCFDDIETLLMGLEDSMEELRNANSRLRDWGEEMEEKYSNWETRALELEGEMEWLKSKQVEA